MLERRLAQFGAVPFTHGALLPLLKSYQRPNDKIAEWLREGVLISLKRGLYVLGPSWRDEELSLPLIANRLYGPSCVSLDYALAWHGLIPERVHELTSVCVRRSRHFENALGRFSYLTIPHELFAVGLQQVEVSARVAFLIAGPEKALCDKILLLRNWRVANQSDMLHFLLDDLRMDEDGLAEMDLATVQQYILGGRKVRQLELLLAALESLR